MYVANHPNASSPFPAQPAVSGAALNDAATTESANSSTSTATITANDFLQLLVTELQNQDPTANTDPNQYVDQLVQVNALQQQIQMNQTLDGGPTLTGSSSGVLQELSQMNQTLSGALSPSGTTADAAAVTHPAPHAHALVAQSAKTSGAAQDAASSIATALVPKPNRMAAPQAEAFEQFASRLKANGLGK